MPLKDYYKLLELPPNAAIPEIKKAYRQLAFKYHPDKNPDNQFAAAHFKELHEAYSILSHPHKRRAYDQERWLAGMGSSIRRQQTVTPLTILDEVTNFGHHMQKIDTYRMSHQALQDYIFLLLSDSNMAILQKAADIDTNRQIIQTILHAISKLKYQYRVPVAAQLQLLAQQDAFSLDMIQQDLFVHKKLHQREKYMPLLVIFIVLCLCIFMYLYVH